MTGRWFCCFLSRCAGVAIAQRQRRLPRGGSLFLRGGSETGAAGRLWGWGGEGRGPQFLGGGSGGGQ